jgi:hypothetical protein
MHSLKRGAVLVVALIFLATPCLAEDNTDNSFFEDLFYGGISGGLIGAAVLAFSKQPGKHLEYIAYGTAGGVLVGATYGALARTRSLAEVKNGKVTFSVPTIMPEIREATPRGHSSIFAMAHLVSGTF